MFLVLGHIQAWRNPGETLSRLQASGNRCRKVKEIEIWRAYRILKWRGKEFCPNKETLRTSLKKKADHAFQGERAAQRRLSEAQSELDSREWRMQIADIAPIPEDGTLSGKLTAQTRRERSWLCNELEMRHRAFQEDRARHCQ